jgi:hypothetical protein
MNSGRHTSTNQLPNGWIQDQGPAFPAWPDQTRGLAQRTLLRLTEAVPPGETVFNRISDAELHLARETLDLLYRGDAATTA